MKAAAAIFKLSLHRRGQGTNLPPTSENWSNSPDACRLSQIFLCRERERGSRCLSEKKGGHRSMGASVVIIIVISVLDIIALGLGIGAERRRTSGTYQSISNATTQWCSYTSDIATGLAAGALVFLLISQLLLAAVTQCFCCGSSLKPGAARAFAFTFCILNWISFSIAEACFLAGAVQDAKHVRYLSSTFSKEISCEAIRKDTFVAGVAFTLFTFILSISYYLCYSKAQEGFGNIRFNKVEPGVSMASYE